MRLVLCFGSFALLVFGASWASGQDLKPGIRFANDGSASWTTDGSWDPGVPGEGEIASIQNGGTASVTSAAPMVDAVSIGNGAVDVGAGGALDVSGEVVVGDGGSLSFSGDGSLKSASLANLGNLSLGGSGAIEISGGFANGGTLVLDGGTLSVSGQATLSGGTIDVSAAPAMGSPIPFLTSAGVKGQPASITVGGATPVLDRGLGLQVAVDAGAASVALGSVPIAVVNRATGEITVENAAGGAIDIKGYELLSENGLLSAENWNGLTAQGAAGWSAIPSSDGNELTELNLGSSSTLAVGDSVSVGNAWTGTTVSPREEDVAFNVLMSDGRTIAGAVEYVGAANDIVLNVDAASGAATLQHLSASLGDLDITGFSILSASGSLSVEGFTGGLGEGFVKANPQDVALGELSLAGSKNFSNGTVIDLGAIFTPGGTQDLTLEFGVAGGDKAQPGTVEYGDPFPPCDPNTGGDLDGDGTVAFADFLILSNNFGTSVSSHADGDIDCSGDVAFADFLVLSNNFGQAVGAEASSVPEPSTGLMILLGVLGMLKFRKRGVHVAAVMAACGLMMMATPNETFAQDEEIETRFIRIHPEGPNSQINSTTEARGILNGTVLDVIVNEDIQSTVLTVDFGGGAGSFANDQNPYGNGVEDGSMNDIIQYVSGVWTIPAGDWTVGFGRDDGGFLRFTNPDVVFIDTFSENGDTVDGDGEILYNGTGGHNWTAGTISVPAGGVTTGIEAAFFERGGGDSFEVGYVEVHYNAADDGPLNGYMAGGFELDNGEFGDWQLTGDPFVAPGASSDLNNDGAVDFADFTIMSDNWGNPYGFDEFFALSQEFEGGAGEANSVPEPASFALILSALAMLISVRRRRR